MPATRVGSIEQYLPAEAPDGCILVVSDYRPLNLGHAATLCHDGFAVYTAVTCTDVPRLLDHFDVGHVDLVAFASLVHGWHHCEAEERPDGIPALTDADWQTRNMKAVVDAVSERQDEPPLVLVASELMTYGWYAVTAQALDSVGLRYGTYSAADPQAISAYLTAAGASTRGAEG